MAMDETRKRRGTLLLGTQSFSNDDWVGPFYPAGTPGSRYLEVYAQRLPTVEIDSTFYGIPRARVVAGWRQRTPEGFRFSAKFPRSITHEKKLEAALVEAAAFVEVMRRLGDKLAVLTLQFARDFTPNYFDRLEAFLGALPGGQRYAVEVRDRRWFETDLGEMLANHNVALVLQDFPGMPRLDWATADFSVIRFLGPRPNFPRFDRIQVDRSEDLAEWADRVRRFLDAGMDVYGYFNDHFAGFAPGSVRQFAAMLGLSLPHPDDRSGPMQQLELGLDER